MAEFEFLGKVINGGRVTIPKTYREKYGIEEGDSVGVKIVTKDSQDD